MKVKLPRLLAIDERFDGNTIQQLLLPACVIEATVADYSGPRLEATMIVPVEGEEQEILLLEKQRNAPDRFARVIRYQERIDKASPEADLSRGIWLTHPQLARGAPMDYAREVERAVRSWNGAFSYIEEDAGRGIKGLRRPQLGAVHAIHAYWSVVNTTATIVMPTGTGKTETMLSVLVSIPCRNVLVVVPTDALRAQIADKFLTLGVLRECGIVSGQALYPVVGVLKHKPKHLAEVDKFFKACNVVVTTSHIAGQCDEVLQARIAEHCSFLFIDEAHHAEAPTWKAFRDKCVQARTLQFTATPFREDDKLIDGKIIYKYPLRKAQEEGYFTRIHFLPIVEFSKVRSDTAIAAKAAEQLRKDAGRKHVLMARVGTIERAQQVFRIYEKYQEFHPVQLHTGIKSQTERERIRQKILRGESRIIVCIDMLGEGFDLPELKIAAFHDIRKSLAVTLQLAGRFTRARRDLGDAMFIANIADIDVKDELRKLYAHDPDWNVLLPELSDYVIEQQIAIKAYLQGFSEFPEDIPLLNLRPATSTVIYRTKCQQWTPEEFHHGIPGLEACARVNFAINHEKNSLLIVTLRRVPLEWAETEEVYTWDWELYVLIWDPEQHLLFINNSSNKGEFRALSQAVAGENVELVRDRPVFRCFAGINRLRLTNVGLTEQLGRLVRYTGRMGADVVAGLSEAQKLHARKAVLFGAGYENGARTTVGASRKGRIWSFQRGRLDALAAWCRHIGAKILDETIDPDQVLKGTLESEIILTRPRAMPIGIDWPEEIYKEVESAYWIVLDDGAELALHDLGIALVDPTLDGPLRFQVFSEDVSVTLQLALWEDAGTKDYRVTVVDAKRVLFGRGLSRVPIEEFFSENPPVIWFADGSSLEGNLFTPLKARYPPYAREKIQTWNWQGIDLRKESQGIDRDPDSIQFKVIATLVRTEQYDIVFDDDGSGEAADVVAIKLVDEAGVKEVHIDLYHCKYSAEAPGKRIKDLYEVCGQAQKSVCWMYSHDKQVDLFSHLLRREPKRWKGQQRTRFEKGDQETLIRLREIARLCSLVMRIFIVQPGVSKEQASVEQLELLSVTDNYLLETYKLSFGVIASQ